MAKKIIPKGRQSNIKRAYEQGREDVIRKVMEIMDSFGRFLRTLDEKEELKGRIKNEKYKPTKKRN